MTKASFMEYKYMYHDLQHLQLFTSLYWRFIRCFANPFRLCALTKQARSVACHQCIVQYYHSSPTSRSGHYQAVQGPQALCSRH